jgi:hypothetical protein
MMQSHTGKDTDKALAQLERPLTPRQPLRKEDLFQQFAEHEEAELEQSRAAIKLQSLRDDKQRLAIQKIDREKESESRKVLEKAAQPKRQYGNQSPIPWTGTEPPFEIASNKGFFGFNSIRPSELVHVLSIGGTGVGKTRSNLAPLLSAQLRYALPCESGVKRSSILVIDPKRELLSTVQSVLAAQGEAKRLVVLGSAEQACPVKFFTHDEHLSLRDKLSKIDVVLGTSRLSEGSHGYWHTAAMQIIEQFMNLEDAYRIRKSESLMVRLIANFGLPVRTKGFWGCLEAVLRHSRCGRRAFKDINRDLTHLLIAASLDLHADAGVMSAYEEETELMQWQYRMQSCDPIIRILSAPEFTKVVDMDPFYSPNTTFLDLREAMETGQVVLFQPSRDPNSALAACAIKTKWQEGVSCRNDMERPVGLVVDEFQRFITIDEVSGDATFLDTARGYRCNAVYATQSIEALQHALKSGAHAQTAVAAIMANTPSKWFFATKDKQTETTMMSLIPASPIIGTPHILTARPAALLKPGEAYWSMADGRWGRGRAVLQNLL